MHRAGVLLGGGRMAPPSHTPSDAHDPPNQYDQPNPRDQRDLRDEPSAGDAAAVSDLPGGDAPGASTPPDAGGPSADAESGASGQGDLDDDIRLTVAGVAARLGVAAPTLRTWARRYGLGPSGHVAGKHRRYGAEDLARLETMRRLTLEGVAPADAARIAMRSTAHSANRGQPGEQDHRAPSAVESANERSSAADTNAAAANSDERPQPSTTADATPMVADPLTIAAAAVDGDVQRLARLTRRAVREHGLLEGWLMTVRPAVEMVAQRPQADRPGRDPELLLHTQMLATLAEVDSSAPPSRGRVLVQYEESQHTDAHVLAAEFLTRGADARVAHRRLETNRGQALLDLVARRPGTLTVILGESETAAHLVEALCARGDEVFLVALTDRIEPRPGLHRARTLTGALHEIMSVLTSLGDGRDVESSA